MSTKVIVQLKIPHFPQIDAGEECKQRLVVPTFTIKAPQAEESISGPTMLSKYVEDYVNRQRYLSERQKSIRETNISRVRDRLYWLAG